jgi:nitrogen fixation NifU-like protein
MLSPIAANHVQRPHNIGPLEGATYGCSGVPGDGPWIEIWLCLETNVIKDAAYRTHGCPSSIASGSMLCDLVRGRTCEQASLIEATDLLIILGGLPEGKGHFASMAVEAVKIALESK